MQKKIYIDIDKKREEYVLLTDEAKKAIECSKAGEPYLFWLTQENRHESIPTGAYCIERLEDISKDYLKKVYQRAKGLPWEILATDRLLIREITVEDVERLYELYADESITRYMEPLFPERQQEEEYTRNYIRNVYHFYGYGMWVIALRESGEVIGRAGFEYKEGMEGLELGFMLGKEYQHKGYAYEACKAILNYAREELEQTSIYAVVHRENLPSLTLCRRLGMQKCQESKTNEKMQVLRLTFLEVK